MMIEINIAEAVALKQLVEAEMKRLRELKYEAPADSIQEAVNRVVNRELNFLSQLYEKLRKEGKNEN